MSSWRDRLSWAEESNSLRKKASFRGATFFIRDSDRSVGRRNVVHQYPNQDDPYIEDLGRDIDEFTINGYVVQNSDNGQDYIDERDALISALRESGSGTLIHPFYGELLVNLVGKAQISESFSEGGIARFTMTFVQTTEGTGLAAAKPPYPEKTQDPAKAVDDVVEDSMADSKDGWYNSFKTEDISGYTANSIMTAISSLNTMLRSAIGIVQGAGPAAISKALSYLTEEYAGISLSTINDTCELANSLINMVSGLTSLVGLYGDIVVDQLLGACSSAVRGFNSGPWSGVQTESSSASYTSLTGNEEINEDFGETVVDALLAVSEYGEEAGSDAVSPYGGKIAWVPIITYQRARQSANLVAIVNLVRNAAIANAMKVAIRIAYSSYETAIETMTKIIDALDAHLVKLGDDAANSDYDPYNITISDPYSFQAMEILRPVFVEAMQEIGAELAKIVEYEVPPVTKTALVLAYEKYKDLNRESEIIGRNRGIIKHPGFMPGGQMIEILSS